RLKTGQYLLQNKRMLDNGWRRSRISRRLALCFSRDLCLFGLSEPFGCQSLRGGLPVAVMLEDRITRKTVVAPIMLKRVGVRAKDVERAIGEKRRAGMIATWPLP